MFLDPIHFIKEEAFSKSFCERIMNIGYKKKLELAKIQDGNQVNRKSHVTFIQDKDIESEVTKVVNELYASVFAKAYGFKTVGLRYFNIFGKRQDPNGAYAAVIPKWVSDILSGTDVFINGDGKTSRDFCYIDNTVQMNLLAATTEGDNSTDQVYNVAVNDQTDLNQLYQMIEEKLINRVGGLTKKKPVYRDFRAGDVRHSLADISKAKNLLGYNPNYRIDEGLNESMDWYISDLKK